MDSFGKIALAAVTAAVAVVAAKKIIDDISANPKESKIIKGYEKVADKVSELISGRKRNKDWTVDFIDDDMDDAFTIEFAADEDDDFDGVEFDISDKVKEAAEDAAQAAEDFIDDIADDFKIDFDQPEDGGMTDDELRDYLEEEAAQEQIDKLLSEIEEDKDDEE